MTTARFEPRCNRRSGVTARVTAYVTTYVTACVAATVHASSPKAGVAARFFPPAFPPYTHLRLDGSHRRWRQVGNHCSSAANHRRGGGYTPYTQLLSLEAPLVPLPLVPVAKAELLKAGCLDLGMPVWHVGGL